MKKGIMFIIVGSLVWFFFIATPQQKADIEKMFLGSDNVVRLSKKAGEPVAPTVIQKLYKPHGIDEDR